MHGADRIDGRAGIWMELIEGRTLEEILKEQGPWDAKAAALAGAELCAALAAVHATGLVHRDVKAQNVMREAGGRIVLMDFGVGHALGHAGRRPAGTPLYMAPEVLAGGNATPRSDLYSLAVLLYHLVTGSYPVRGETIEDLKKAHAAPARTFLRDARPELPDAFVGAVERALEPEPEHRFATAGEMEQALLENLRPEARAGGQRRRLLPGLSAAAVLAVVALLLLQPPPEEAPHPPETGPRDHQPSFSVSVAPTSAQPRDRARQPSKDPFVAPLGAPSSGESAAPPVETAYTIDAVIAGDELRVRASAALSLYVLAIDEAGQPTLLFPIPGRRPENPLVPGQETRLWIGAALRGSRMVAIASPVRLVDLEAEMARQRVPLASWRGSLPLTPSALSHLASALGFPPSATGRLLAGATPLPGHVEMLRGVWIRRLER